MYASSGLVTATRPCRLRGVGQLLGGLGLLLLALAPWSPALAGPGAQQVVGGEGHTCALTSTGGVWCWGANDSGQLGDGSNTLRNTPVAVAGLDPGVNVLAAGSFHTCAAAGSGTAWCWGRNDFGQLGDGSGVAANTPVVVALPTSASALAAGYSHTCALDDQGAVYCWGRNNFGQLGDGTKVDSSVPVTVIDFGGPVVALAAGAEHTCALLTGGGVKCWGRNNFGQLGDDTKVDRSTPVTVTGLGGPVVALAAGAEHTCALLDDGTVACWGRNDSGQLGNGTSGDSWTPVVVKNPEGTDPLYPVLGIALGSFHSCALLDDFNVQCWGRNDQGQLGNNTTTTNPTTLPVAVRNREDTDDLYSIDGLGAGASHTCALTDFGAVWCWGLNSSSQLGTGSQTTSGQLINQSTAGSNPLVGSPTNIPLPVATRVPATLGLSGTMKGPSGKVVAGYVHSCALTSGAAWCWGDNVYGELGNGGTVRSNTPVAVSGLGSGVTVLEAGLDHTCALMNDTTVKCWGTNAKGQLGAGASAVTKIQSTPVAVKDQAGTGTLNGVTALSAGNIHTCALTNAGAALCWGNNAWGQLGTGTSANAYTPTAIVAANGFDPSSGVTALSAGYSHTCALQGGAVWCWGINLDGQLGNGSNNQKSKTPVRVKDSTGSADLTGVAALSAGYYHTCALLSDKTVMCWGANDYGQLGNGDKLDQKVPVAVDLTGLPGGETVAAVSAGRYHTCVLTNTGGVWCWGGNTEAQLGDRTTVERLFPVAAMARAGTDALTGVTDLAAGGHHTCSRTSTGEIWCWGWDLYGQLGTAGFISADDPSTSVAITATLPWPASDLATLTVTVTGVTITPENYSLTPPPPPWSPPGISSVGSPGKQTKANALATPPDFTIPAGEASGSLIFTLLPGLAGPEIATLGITNPIGDIVLANPASATVTLLETMAPPTNVTVKPGDRSMTVSFTPSPGATGYSATCTSSDGGAPATATGTASPILVSGLTTGKTYSCTVAANYGQASSDPSPASDPVIVTAPAAIPTLSQWGLLMLGGLLAAFGMRRRQRLPTR